MERAACTTKVAPISRVSPAAIGHPPVTVWQPLTTLSGRVCGKGRIPIKAVKVVVNDVAPFGAVCEARKVTALPFTI